MNGKRDLGRVIATSNRLTRVQAATVRMTHGLPLSGDEALLVDRGIDLEHRAALGILEAAAFDKLVEPLPAHLPVSSGSQRSARHFFGAGARLGQDAVAEALRLQFGTPASLD